MHTPTRSDFAENSPTGGLPAGTSHAEVVLLGHGSRYGTANEEFLRFVHECAAQWTQWNVRPAFVELAEPSLDDALDGAAGAAAGAVTGVATGETSLLASATGTLARRAPGGRAVVVVPLFLSTAGHVKNDLPLALAAARRRNPRARFLAARPAGLHPALIARMRSLAKAHMDTPAQTSALVVVGRGSSDADANAEFSKLTRLVTEALGVPWGLACFAGIAPPGLAETLALLVRLRPSGIIVVPALFFPGRVLEQIQTCCSEFRERHPWIDLRLTPTLGGGVFRAALATRIAEALRGEALLPCDTCAYRPPASQAERLGWNALLWSQRRRLSHHWSTGEAHAHGPLKRHVLVCNSADCVERGSPALLTALWRALRAAELRSVRLTATACLGRCGEGPNLCVYPDGVWYRGTQASDAEALVQEHLLKDRPLKQRVDWIMQG